MTDKHNKIITFQLKLPDELNRLILQDAAGKGINKHEWIESLIKRELLQAN